MNNLIKHLLGSALVCAHAGHVDGARDVVLQSDLLLLVGAAVRLLAALALVVLGLVVLLTHGDLALNLECVGADVLARVVFVCAGSFVAAGDCINDVQLVGQLGVVGRGVGIRTSIVFTGGAGAESTI